MKICKALLFLCIFTFNLFSQDATMEVVKKLTMYPKISVLDTSSTYIEPKIKQRFFNLLQGDLKTSAHFEVVNFTLEQANSQFILEYSLSASLNFMADVKLLNAQNKEIKFEKKYSINDVEAYAFLAHEIIWDINKHFGFEPIDWIKRQVLIAKNIRPMQTDIMLCDYTLSYQKALVSGGLNLFPKWGDKEQNIFYFTSFSDDKPTLYKVDKKTGAKTKIISSDGMLVASDVSADTNKLLLTMAPEGQADIYLYDLKTHEAKRLTFYKGIDVNGGFVDDEKCIVFVSDRMGNPNIFAKTLGKQGVEQIVFHGKNNNASSTHGQYVVYSSRDKSSEFGEGTFNLYLISTKTQFIRQLTANGKNQFPRFSKDGTSILFIKNYANQSALGLIRLSENKSFHFPLDVGQIQAIDW